MTDPMTFIDALAKARVTITVLGPAPAYTPVQTIECANQTEADTKLGELVLAKGQTTQVTTHVNEYLAGEGA